MSATSDVLHGEHELLGASFAAGDAAGPVASYGDPAAESCALAEEGSCGLCDLSGLFVQLVEGDVAPAFVAACCGAAPLDVGAVAFGAVLAGDGATVGVPLVCRTGSCEYVVADATLRAPVLQGWLGFLSAVEQDGVMPFARARLTDATGVHVPLVLAGKVARAVLADYVAQAGDLPAAGGICPLVLDGRIECVCASLPACQDADGGAACYLLLVPPAAARVLWRSLLSFPSVTPVGTRALSRALGRDLPWLPRLQTAGRLCLPASELAAWGLVREGGGFVGARALSDVRDASQQQAPSERERT